MKTNKNKEEEVREARSEDKIEELATSPFILCREPLALIGFSQLYSPNWVSFKPNNIY